MLYGLAYLSTMLRSNAGESIGLTKACSVSVRWQVGQIVIANEMRQEKKHSILKLQYK